MINVSSEYKKAIKEPSRSFKSIILINNKTYSNREILSINYDENLFMESEFSIGSAIMSSIEVELINTQDVIDNFIEGNEFEIKIGIETSTDTFEFISLGFFIIEDIDKDIFSIKIYANDRMAKFETDYITDLQFPATIKDITLDIAKKAGIKLKTDTFVNSDYLVPIKPDLTDVTLRKALMYIAELAGGYARISREGYLEIFNIDVSVKSNFNYASERLYTDEIIGDEIGDYGLDAFTVINYVSEILYADEIINDETSIYNYNTFTGDNLITFSNKAFTISKIDKVVIEIPSIKEELGEGENTYYIVDNLFCQNPAAVIKNIYNVLSKISYVPYDVKLQGDPAFQAGDSIIIKTNGILINTLITNRTLSYTPGGLAEQYKAVGKSNTEKQSTGKGNVSIELDKAKTEITVMAGEIEQKVSQDDFESTIEQTVDSIRSEVKNTKEGLESTIEQTANGIRSEVKNTKEGLESAIEQTAESISSKVSNKDFESYQKQTAEEISSKVTGKDVETLVKQNAESWELSIKGKLKGTNYKFDGNNFSIGTTNGLDKAYHSATYSRWNHSDGSYTQASSAGLIKYDGGTGRKYHYLMHAGTVQVNNSVWVTLPAHIANKVGTNYAVSISVKGYGFNDYRTMALMQVYCTVLGKLPDKFQIRVDLYGWRPEKDDYRGQQTIGGWVNVDYVIVA